MSKIFKPLLAAIVATILFTACKKEATQEPKSEQISDEVIAQIKALGFGTGGVQKVDDGYIVEGDILLTPQHLKSKPKMEFLRIGEEEQYRTSNTVLGLPRTISIRISSAGFTAAERARYFSLTDSAVRRYNALKTTSTNFLLTFKMVPLTTTTGGSIVVTKITGVGYLASAGFPFDSGSPYNAIQVNTDYLNIWNNNTVISIMAHEIGHCIGFRHTDFMNRSLSCGGAAVNEGAGTIGAKLIPGTPSGFSADSWMLACIGNGINRPFTAHDKIALKFLY